MTNVPFTDLMLGLLAILLVVAAAIDLKTRTIPNWLNALVALLAPVFWLVAGLDPWPGMAIQLGMGVAVFAVFALAFFVGMMGGGDVKLAAALALWFAPLSTLKFLVIMSLAGGVLTFFYVILHRLQKREGKPKIPYGVAIAFGALAILAQRFLNQFA
jgi:prepilin peptidase CpaA